MIRNVIDLFLAVLAGFALLLLSWAAVTHPWGLLLVLAAFVSGVALGGGAVFVAMAIGLAEAKKKTADSQGAGGQGVQASAASTPRGQAAPVDMATVLQVVQQYEDRCRKATADLNAAARGLKVSAWWN